VTDRQSRFASASQVISGLNWIALEHPEVRVVNMSLGSDELFSGACDNASAYTLAYASAVASLRARGAVVFAASGNNGSATSMAAPACIESVVAVGAVYDSGVGSFSAFGCGDATTEADQPACFSNSGPQLDLLAPGAPITSARLGGGSGVFWGTSEATPHAAGAAALLFESDSRAAPDRVEALLETSGKPVRDARNARVTPRVDVAAALRLGKIPAAPEALVSSDALAFGKVRVRRTATRSVGVSNPGTVPVTVTVSRPAAPFAAGAPRSFAVQPGETARIVVRFAPRKAKIYRATLTLGTDDPTQPQIRVALSGRGA
jgi:subtilisin family serine protease